jgi:hypothetical protein
MATEHSAPEGAERVLATEKPLDYAEILGVLRATHRDTWPSQTGFGDLINPDGPEAADAIADLVAENERLRKRASKLERRYDEAIDERNATRAALKQD